MICNKKSLGFIFGSFLAAVMCLLLIPAMNVSAAVSDGQPQVHVIELSLAKRSFKAGEEISGTFVLFNRSSINASDVSYEIALLGDYQNGEPRVVYDVKKYEPTVFLRAGEKKPVPLFYVLPKNVAGDILGIRVQAIIGSGRLVGWMDSLISVAGQMSVAKVKKAELLVGNQVFLPEAGPIVGGGETVDYRVVFSNPTNIDITFAPNIKIYNRASTGELLLEYREPSMTVPAGQDKTAVFSIPTFNYAPRIYAGEVTFRDSRGEVRAPALTFRYVISGDVATIQSVTSDVEQATKGDRVPVTIYYSGAPFNPVTREKQLVGIATLEVTLQNENGSVVGKGAAQIDLDGKERSKDFAITATGNAKALSVKVAIRKGSETLANYETALSSSLSQSAKIESPKSGAQTLVILIVGVLMLVLALFALIKLKKKDLPPPSTGTPGAGNSSTPSTTGGMSAGGLGLLIVTTAALGFGFLAPKAEAYVETFRSDPVFAPTLFVNNPYDNQTILPGSTFYISGRSEFRECSNMISYEGFIRATFNGQTKSADQSSGGGGQNQLITTTFNLGPFTAPSTLGTYRIYFRDEAKGRAPDGSYFLPDYSEGYVDVVVSGSPLPPPTLTGTTPEGGGQCAGALILSWTSVPGATSYELYRNSNPVPIYAGSNKSYTDSGLAPGSSYDYIARAMSPSGNSGPSNLVRHLSSDCLPLSINCQASPTTAYTFEDISWNVSVSGGVAPFQYAFSGTDNFTAGGQSASRTFSALKFYETPGNKFADIDVSSSDGQSIENYSCTGAVGASYVTILQGAINNLSCSGSPQNPKVGDIVTWTANPAPAGSYTYAWSGDDGLSGSTQTIPKIYATPGVKTARVSVVDVTGSPECSATVRVLTNPNYQEI